MESEKPSFEAFESFIFQSMRLSRRRTCAAIRFEGKGYRTVRLATWLSVARTRGFLLMMLLTIKDAKIVEKRAHFDVGATLAPAHGGLDA